MAFHLSISEVSEQYLDNLPLSLRAKKLLGDFIDYAIAEVSDEVRLDPQIRSGSSVFTVHFYIVDVWGDDRWHQILFHVAMTAKQNLAY